MRVMVLVKATEDSEKGFIPTSEMKKSMEAMGRFNEELVKAGIMKADDCDGLTPSSKGKRIAFDGASRTVIDGPFADARTSWLPVSGSGTSRTWTRRLIGWTDASIPCRDRVRSKSGHYFE